MFFLMIYTQCHSHDLDESLEALERVKKYTHIYKKSNLFIYTT